MKKKIYSTIVVLGFSCYFMQSVSAYPLINDEIPSEFLNSRKAVYEEKIIEDEAQYLLENTENEKHQYCKVIYNDKAVKNLVFTNLLKKEYTPELFSEKPVPHSEMLTNFEKPVYNQILDLENGTEVKLKPVKSYLSKTSMMFYNIDGKKLYGVCEDPLIGTKAEFLNVEDVYVNGILTIPKGKKVYGYVGVSTPSESGGIEGEIAVERLWTTDVNGNKVKLKGTISNEGFTTSYLYSLAGGVLAPLTMGLSEMLIILPGASGRINANKIYKVYYKE